MLRCPWHCKLSSCKQCVHSNAATLTLLIMAKAHCPPIYNKSLFGHCRSQAQLSCCMLVCIMTSIPRTSEYRWLSTKVLLCRVFKESQDDPSQSDGTPIPLSIVCMFDACIQKGNSLSSTRISWVRILLFAPDRLLQFCN